MRAVSGRSSSEAAADGPLFAAVATHGVAVATALGFWAYLTTWWVNARFYSVLNVSLREVGLGHDDLLPIGATLLFVTGFFAASMVVVFGVVYGLLRWAIRSMAFEWGPSTEVVASWLLASTVLVLVLLSTTTVWMSVGIGCLMAASLGWSVRRPQMPTGEASYPLRIALLGLLFLVPMSITAWALNVADEAALEFRRCARDLEGVDGWIADLVILPELVAARNGPSTVEATWLWLLGSDEGVAVLLDRDDSWIHRVPMTEIELVGLAPGPPDGGGTGGGAPPASACRATDGP